jgi:hypothetical protein
LEGDKCPQFRVNIENTTFNSNTIDGFVKEISKFFKKKISMKVGLSILGFQNQKIIDLLQIDENGDIENEIELKPIINQKKSEKKRVSFSNDVLDTIDFIPCPICNRYYFILIIRRHSKYTIFDHIKYKHKNTDKKLIKNTIEKYLEIEKTHQR